MWKEYFHPDSTIVGIDIDTSCQAHEIADQNVFVRIGSQADPTFLASVNGEFGPFNIILDDGSHKTHHQIISFGALFRDALKDGGCYMVEDVHTNYWIKLVGTVRYRSSDFGKFCFCLSNTTMESWNDMLLRLADR